MEEAENGMERIRVAYHGELVRMDLSNESFTEGLAMPQQLSKDALTLLHACVAGRKPDVDDSTRPAYRELAALGIMIPLHTFAKGRESAYRFTEDGWKRRLELLAIAGAVATVN